MGYTHLVKYSGPECPACGCRDSDHASTRPRAAGGDAGGWFSRSGEVRRCNHCGKIWHAPASPPEAPENFQEKVKTRGGGPDPAKADEEAGGGAITFAVNACPFCGSGDTVVTSTRRPVRYHKCRACRLTFKSVES